MFWILPQIDILCISAVKLHRAIKDNLLFKCHLFSCALEFIEAKQDAQLSQRDRAAGCIIIFAKSRRLELGDNILRTL